MVEEYPFASSSNVGKVMLRKASKAVGRCRGG